MVLSCGLSWFIISFLHLLLWKSWFLTRWSLQHWPSTKMTSSPTVQPWWAVVDNSAHTKELVTAFLTQMNTHLSDIMWNHFNQIRLVRWTKCYCRNFLRYRALLYMLYVDSTYCIHIRDCHYSTSFTLTSPCNEADWLKLIGLSYAPQAEESLRVYVSPQQGHRKGWSMTSTPMKARTFQSHLLRFSTILPLGMICKVTLVGSIQCQTFASWTLPRACGGQPLACKRKCLCRCQWQIPCVWLHGKLPTALEKAEKVVMKCKSVVSPCQLLSLLCLLSLCFNRKVVALSPSFDLVLTCGLFSGTPGCLPGYAVHLQRWELHLCHPQFRFLYCGWLLGPFGRQGWTGWALFSFGLFTVRPLN